MAKDQIELPACKGVIPREVLDATYSDRPIFYPVTPANEAAMRCRKCNGEGYVEYDEDNRLVRDACYHCGTTGVVDEETDFHDRVKAVADTLAYQEESEYRQACDEDPLGDGYTLHAAENMLSAGDYFRLRVWERSERIGAKLAEMPLPDRELLIAWNEQPRFQPQVSYPVTPKTSAAPVEHKASLMRECDDDIPF